MAKANAKKRKINKKKTYRVVFLLILVFICIKLLTMHVTNIYIKGNTYLKDWEVIEIAKLSNYPKLYRNPNIIIKKRLKNSDNIIDAKVHKIFGKVYIEVLENRPLFYDSNKEVTIMLDRSTRNTNMVAPYLSNYIPDVIYDKFVDTMMTIDIDILNRISEITYKPNTVDQERFYLSMSDGNYVYLTLNGFGRINSYIDMIKQFQNKKGILYLDSGEYFEIKN